MATTSVVDTSNIPGILKSLDLYKYNPAAIQRVVLQHLSDVTAGAVDIVDATNPFVFSLEASSVNTAAFMAESEANTRKLYPALAQTSEDLYIHMSDNDFVDRFATPAKTIFSIMIQMDDLLRKMIDDPITLGRKVIIPGNSEFTIAETTFSLQYPIEIRELVHGGLQIVYNTDIASPLQTLTTNVIPFEIRTDAAKINWIYFEFEVYQFKVNTTNGSVNSATGFSQNIGLTDEYYYARVYYKSSTTGVWKEILTTHTDQVYDPSKATAVLKVVDKVLNVVIPQIYINSGLVTGTLRIDVYETKGSVNMIMDSYALSAFSVKWKNLDKAQDSVYTAVIPTLIALAYSSKPINDGGAALTFDQLRARVITNSIGDRNIPITNVQLESTLERQGYSVVKDIDVVTNRVFLATRALPKPINSKLITSAASSIQTFVTTINDAITNVGVYNNGSRITLSPDIVYTNESGIIKVFSKVQLDALLALSPDDIATFVTSKNFLYTPFHYVLDTSANEFEVRPYYLDAPVAKTVRFIEQNDLTSLQINTSKYSVFRTNTGYKLTVVTKSNTLMKDLDDSLVFAQLAYIPIGEDTRAYLNGTMTGRTTDNERIFEFDLSTNFDIDSKDNISLQKFLMFTVDPRITSCPLSVEFDILYSTNTSMPTGWSANSIDQILGKFNLPSQTVGVTQEKLKVIFGYSLNTLWARSRSVVSASLYQKYTANVPWLYEKDVYQVDPTTGTIFSVVGSNVVYTKLHSIGDPILDGNGNPTFKHLIGDVVLDTNGQPVPTDVAKVARQIDIMFIEGAYYFATDSAAAAYRQDAVSALITWLTDDLINMGNNLIEQTRLYFYPKTTMGNISVVADDASVVNIEAGQYFNVDLYVNSSVYQNADLRETLRKTTISTIDSILQNPTVSISDIVSQLSSKYGSDVFSFTVSGLGGASNISAISMLRAGDRCNIRKRLVKLPDNKLIVQEDVTVNFIKHGA